MGLDVFTVPCKGYSLPGAIQLLEAERILSLLEDKRVSVLPVVDSTNQYLLDRIAELHPVTPASLNTNRRRAPWAAVDLAIRRQFIPVDVLALGARPGGGHGAQLGNRDGDGGSSAASRCRRRAR